MMIAVRWAAARWRVKASATTPWRFGSTAAGEAASTSFGNKEEEDQEAWYASEEGGLSFRCTRCGRCCGLEGTRKVHVSDREIEEIARLLGEPETSVREDRVTRTETGHQVLRGKQRGSNRTHLESLHNNNNQTLPPLSRPRGGPTGISLIGASRSSPWPAGARSEPPRSPRRYLFPVHRLSSLLSPAPERAGETLPRGRPMVSPSLTPSTPGGSFSSELFSPHQPDRV